MGGAVGYAAGMFAPFEADAGVACFGVEASGHGVETREHAATLTKGRVGILHGSKSYVLCDPDGQISEAHSISAGLDYPGVGPEHAFYAAAGRGTYVSATDMEALDAIKLLCETEGILPALETAHAIAHLPALAKEMSEDDIAIVCCSGRGDKDMGTISKHLF